MENFILLGLLVILAVGYLAAPLLSLSAQRRRDARALRAYLLKDVRAGRRSLNEPAVAMVLSWCNEVVETGRDLPLLAGSRPSSSTRTGQHQN
jgi:hypothetical protein